MVGKFKLQYGLFVGIIFIMHHLNIGYAEDLTKSNVLTVNGEEYQEEKKDLSDSLKNRGFSEHLVDTLMVQVDRVKGQPIQKDDKVKRSLENVIHGDWVNTTEEFGQSEIKKN